MSQKVQDLFPLLRGTVSECCVKPFLPRALKQQIVDNLSFKGYYCSQGHLASDSSVDRAERAENQRGRNQA